MCIKISILEARWSNSLSTSSSVNNCRLSVYSDCFRKSVIAHWILHRVTILFHFEFFWCQLLLTYPVFSMKMFIYVIISSYVLAVFLNVFSLSFFLFLSALFYISIAALQCATWLTEYILTALHADICTLLQLLPIFLYKEKHIFERYLSLFSSSLSHSHFFQQTRR